MTDLSNATTKVKSADAMIKKYETLSNKIYKTAAEQEALNDVIREMGDTFDIDVITDEYGNLAININTVRAEYEKLESARQEKMAKMEEKEKEQIKAATSGLGNENTASDVYAKIYKENSSEYRSLLKGINDSMDKETRQIGDTLYQTINTAFKESLLDNLQDNLEYYAVDGLAESLTTLENDINSTLTKNGGWDYMYEQIQKFKNDIDNMSWDEFAAKFQDVFENWRKEIGLTTEQWLILQDAIQDTIWGSENKQFVDYMNQYDSNNNKMKAAEAKRDEYQKRMQEKYQDLEFNINITTTTVDPTTGQTYTQTHTKTYKGFDDVFYNLYNENGQKGSGSMFFQKQKWWQKLFSPISSWNNMDMENEDIGKDLEKYNILIENAEQTAKTLNEGAVKLHDALAGVDAGTLDYYKQIGNMYDISSFQKKDKNGKLLYDDNGQAIYDEEAITQYTNIMAKAVEAGKKYVAESDIGLAMLKVINEELENNPDGLKEGVDAQLEAVKKEIEDEMRKTSVFT